MAVLHSNRTQREREQALQGFREGRFEVLVATDIAARGLDIAEVSHVVNYDVPQHPEDYIHRIGRTGRAEHTGDAFTIMVAEDAPHVFAIERFISQKIPRVKLENFDYRYTALFEEEQARRVPRRISRQSSRRPHPRRLPLRPRRPAPVTDGFAPAPPNGGPSCEDVPGPLLRDARLPGAANPVAHQFSRD